MAENETSISLKRSAEKDRPVSTCKWADRVASLSIETFRQLCPQDLVYQQTVLATVLMRIEEEGGVGGVGGGMSGGEERSGGGGVRVRLHVVGLGVGTKTLSAHKMQSDCDCGGGADGFLRDMHAEVLARRAFLRFCCDAIATGRQSFFLQRDDQSDNSSYRLKPGVSLHLYSSSQPCGNACIKKWAKAKRVVERVDLSEDVLPDLPHPTFWPTATIEGEVMPLVKVNNANQLPLPIACVVAPPGTAPVHSGLGNVMTCSDKIALWNAVGMQGALLSLLLREPFYLSSLTIGRKFSEAHCRRALCCRIRDFSFPDNQIATKKRKGNKNKRQRELSLEEQSPSCPAEEGDGDGPIFVAHHPAMLTSKIKFDQGSLLCQPVEDHATRNGALFDETRCFVAWLNPRWEDEKAQGRGSICPEGILSRDWLPANCFAMEVIDSHTGFTCSGQSSQLSAKRLFETIREIASSSPDLVHLSELRGLDQWKAASNSYAAAKAQLKSSATCLGDWVRKRGPQNG